MSSLFRAVVGPPASPRYSGDRYNNRCSNGNYGIRFPW
jgi:hypothetical protein